MLARVSENSKSALLALDGVEVTVAREKMIKIIEHFIVGKESVSKFNVLSVLELLLKFYTVGNGL